MRVKENKTRTELEKLEPISHKISSCPKDFIKYGRFFVA